MARSKGGRPEVTDRTEELRYLVDLAPVGFALFRGGRLAYANRRFEEITGHGVSEPPCPELTRLLRPERTGHHQLASLRCRQCQPAASFPCRRADREERWVEAWVWRVHEKGGPAFACVLHDGTEQKRLEARVEHAGKLNAIGRLTGGIAHDFGNVVQVIQGGCALARDHMDDRQEVERSLGMVEGASRQAAALTHQLLAFGRKQVSQARTVDLRAAVARDHAMLSRLLGDDVRLTLRAPAAACFVKIDPAQIEQVIMNLAVNARDAMPGGGTIEIEVRRRDQEVELAVIDTGVGMDKGTLAHVFEPFFTTKEQGKGTGLGLSIVRGIVARNGGSIRVRSSPGAGTRFTISLPRVEPEP